MGKFFHSAAIPKCFDRLGKAKRSLQSCRSCTTFEEFSSHWSEFLIHTGSILNALDAGSKATPQGRQWYGGVKRAARADPLVSYMHQARNAEEHALDPTTTFKNPSISIGRNEDVYIDDFRDGPEFRADPEKYIAGRAWRTEDGKPPTITRSPGGPALRPVEDQFKSVFPPPTEHNGKPLPKTDPIAIADRYIDYLEGVVLKASEL